MELISREAVLDETIRRNSIWKGITNSRGENLEQIVNRLPTIQSKKDNSSDASYQHTINEFNKVVQEQAEEIRTLKETIKDFESAIQALEQTKKGEWIEKDGEHYCSKCGIKAHYFKLPFGKVVWCRDNFCPNCGADMRGDKE